MDINTFLNNFPNHIFCALDHPNWWKISQNISIDDLEDFNSINNKCDIYFTPNWDYKLSMGNSKKWRTKANAKNIYSFIVEIDDNNSKWEEKGLQPNIVVQTKKWVHLYFLLDQPIDYKKHKSKWDTIEKKLITIYGADPQVKDISRILRVPWFKYWKDNTWELEIKVINHNDKKYSLFDFQNRVDALYESYWIEDKHRENLSKDVGNVADIESYFKQLQETVKVDKLLLDLSSGRYECQPNWSIYDHDEKDLLSGFKFNSHENYLNAEFSGHDRPQWWPFSIAKYYLRTTSNVIDYFEKYYNVEFSMESKKKIKMTTTERDWKIMVWERTNWIVYDYDEQVIWGFNANWEQVFIDGIIEPIWFYEKDNELNFIVNIKKWAYEKITTLPHIWTTSDISKFLQKFWLVIADNVTWRKYLMQYLMSGKERYEYTNKLGLQKLWWEKLTICKAGTWVDTHKRIMVDIPDLSWDYIEVPREYNDIKKNIQTLSEAYSLDIAYPLVLLCIIWVNAFRFRENNMQLPWWFILWLSQSGKTTMKNYILDKMFWIKLKQSANSKAFTYQNLARHYIPIGFSEYRNSSMTQHQEIMWVLRNMFDWETIRKGTQSQKMNEYHHNWLIIFDWQTAFTDDALLTRNILLFAQGKHKWSLKAFNKLENIFASSAKLLQDFDWFEEKSREIKEELRDRWWLKRWDERTLQIYSYLVTVGRILGLEEYEHHILFNLSKQDSYTATDDIKKTYLKMFNMQSIYKFSTRVYRRGIIIEAMEESIRIGNIEDLEWFIKTANHEFLWDNELSWLHTYIDLDYVFKNKDLRPSFTRMLYYVPISREDFKWEQEVSALKALKDFLADNYPDHETLSDLKVELKVKKKQENETPF